ncbi:MAG: hypothetical protein COA78_23810 [Blastopirellula sp.]|nr:MAG: hypothetical protein COA78_23810 [Blastopirellula sp.]
MNFNRTIIRFAYVFCAVLCLASHASAQDLLVPHEHHEWASFAPGSWKQLRQTNETFKDGELVSTSITTSTIRLKEVDRDSILLERSAKSEVRGQVYDKPLREFRTGLNGQPPNRIARITLKGNTQIVIYGKSYPCQVREVEIHSDTSKIVGTVHYSASVAPYLLKKEYEILSPSSGDIQKKITTEILSLGLPFKVLAEIKEVAFLKTTEKTATKTIETIEVQSTEVPGFIVANWVTTRDANNQIIARSTTEILNYETKLVQDMQTSARSKGLFRNRNSRRVFETPEEKSK